MYFAKNNILRKAFSGENRFCIKMFFRLNETEKGKGYGKII
jgi:hypothetical protein